MAPQEVKFCYQNIAVDVQKDKAVVKNKNLFVNTDAFDCVVILEKEGKKLKEVPMEISVEPLSEKTVELPIAVQSRIMAAVRIFVEQLILRGGRMGYS